MFRTLVRIRLLALWNDMFRNIRGNKKRGVLFKIGIGLLTLYCLGAVFLMFGMLFYSLCEPLYSNGLGWFYFALAEIIALMLSFIGSVFFAKSILFDAKDNELLLSLPVRPSAILLSRLITLLAINCLYTLLIAIPAGVVWLVFCPVTAGGITLYTLSVFISPLLSAALSCLFGWVLAVVGARIRRKNLITFLFSAFFLGAYLYGYANVQKYIAVLLAKGEEIASVIKGTLPFAYRFGLASTGSAMNFLMFALWCAVPICAVCVLLSRSFIRVTTTKLSVSKPKYRARAMRVSKIQKALVVKEFRRFIANPSYMINAGFGMIFTVVVSVMIVIKREEMLSFVMSEFGAGLDISQYTGAVAVLILCALSAFDFISAPSISLEGKSLWIAQSIPVRGRDILLSKALMHFVISEPFNLLGGTVIALTLPMTAADIAFLFILPVLTTAFTALFGVFANLKFNRFDWISEIAVIKQSTASMIAVFGGMGIIALPVLLYTIVFKASFDVSYALLGFALFLALLSAALYGYLVQKGDSAFALLNQ